MSDYAGFICHVEDIRQAAQDARNLLASLSHDALSIQHLAKSGLFMWRQQTLASAAILTMLEEFVAAGAEVGAHELFLTHRAPACR